MSNPSAIVWIFDSRAEAEASIQELHSRNFDMKQLSIVGRDYQTEERVVGFYTVGERMKVWGRFGACWGGLWGLLFGAATWVVPALDSLVVLSPLLGWIASALLGALVVGGVSALAAALYGLGVQKHSALRFATAIRANMFVLVAHGSMADVATAQAILAARHASSSRPRTLPAPAASTPALAAIAVGASR